MPRGRAASAVSTRTKPPGRLQEAPLTAEYQAIYEANLTDQASGGQGVDPTYRCLSPGMPRIMHAYSPMEIVVTAGHHAYPDRAHPRQPPHPH